MEQNHDVGTSEAADMRTIGIGKSPLTAAQIELLDALAREHGCRLIDLSKERPDDRGQIEQCQALLGHFDAESIKAAKALRWLQVPSAGVDKLLTDDIYPNRDVVLTNASGAYGIAISEYMICGLLMLMRRMPQYLDNQKRREWKQYPGISTLYGSRVTVVGVGDLGGSFAARCRTLGARVAGVRRTERADRPEFLDEVFAADRLDDAIRDADAVALCLPSTKETSKLFDAGRFERMKRSAILINVGRGTAVDQDALCAAIQAKHLGGALLDVTDPEPLPADSPLWSLENVIITPHISGIDRDFLAAGIVFDIFRDNLERFLSGKPLKNVVDRSRGY